MKPSGTTPVRRLASALAALAATAVLAAACAQPTPTPTPTPSPTPLTPSPSPETPAPGTTPVGNAAPQVVTVPLRAVGDSGQSGTALLTARGDATQVVVSMTPSPEGVPQPIHIHSGSCATLGSIVHPLSPVTNGTSTTTVEAPLPSLLTGRFAINAHRSREDLATSIACGDIPASP